MVSVLAKWEQRNKGKYSKYIDLGLYSQKVSKANPFNRHYHKLIVFCAECGKHKRIYSLWTFTLPFKCVYCARKQGGRHVFDSNIRKIFINLAISKGHSEDSAAALYSALTKKRREILKRCYSNRPKYKLWQNLPEPKVCDEWRYTQLSFLQWGLENGYNLETNKVSINRINQNKGYSPKNCEIITELENSTTNAEYYKEAKIFYYSDCKLYLSLNQRAQWLGYKNRQSLLRKNSAGAYYNIRTTKKGFKRSLDLISKMQKMSKINEKCIEKGLVKFLGKISKNTKTISLDYLKTLIKDS